MAGDCGFLLRIVATDLDDYRRFQVAYLTCIERGKASRPRYQCRPFTEWLHGGRGKLIREPGLPAPLNQAFPSPQCHHPANGKAV